MSEERPNHSADGPLVPRWVITIVTLALTGALLYSATQRDWRSMAISGLAIIFILGADLGQMIRFWRGGGQ